MGWHYVLMRYADGEVGLHEFYPSPGIGGWTRDGVSFSGQDAREVRRALLMALRDIRRYPLRDHVTGAEIRYTITPKGMEMLK